MLFEVNFEMASFLHALHKAGYIPDVENLSRAYDASTVDELIECLGLDLAGKKYVLGYFGGSGSIPITFDPK